MSALIALRSLLFVPGSRPDRFAKALATSADMVAIDLEDAVAPGDKAAARSGVLGFLADAGADEAQRIAVRTNGLQTRDGLEDLVALAGRGLACVLLPKVEAVRDVEIAASVLGETCMLMPLVETVRGLEAAAAVAAHPAVGALMFGGADFAAEIGATMDWEPLYAARARLVMAAAGAGKPLVDVPHVVLDDPEGLAATADRVKAMGFAGKACIHPRQVDAVNRAFSPTEAEAERARRIVEAFQRSGLGQVDGELVEAPVVRRCERVLALVERHS